MGTVTSVNLPDVLLLTGPVGATVLLPLSWTAVAVARGPRWMLVLGSTLAGVAALSWAAYWFLWGQAFDHADNGEPVPDRVDVASNVAMTLCALGCVALVALAAGAVAARRADRRHPEP